MFVTFVNVFLNEQIRIYEEYLFDKQTFFVDIILKQRKVLYLRDGRKVSNSWGTQHNCTFEIVEEPERLFYSFPKKVGGTCHLGTPVLPALYLFTFFERLLQLCNLRNEYGCLNIHYI